MGRYTEAQKKSAQKYLSKMAEIKIRIQPDFKKEIEAAAYKDGKSVQAYVIEAIADKMKN